ncbi:MAG: N-formylglutamate amidohydrolase [Betaproteobacteria bacterium]|nr:N-formylglutamate amidohydrolase [Betaproteobacteria bacterium]
MSWLDATEPPPFTLEYAQGRSPYLLTCDHASCRLPARLGRLGLSDQALETHIASDIGAAGVARRLADALDAFLIMTNYSRLAIDCNRPPGSADSIVARSENTEIPGNRVVSAGEAEARANALFHPYHNRIRAELDARRVRGRPAVLLALHSFTPVYHGLERPWHAGLLYGRDSRLGCVLLELLRAEPGLNIGDNQPYAASDLTDYAIPVHGERRGILHTGLEIRQDLIADGRGQAAWATRLAPLLEIALSKLPSH